MKSSTTDFVNFGAYKAGEADILKNELEKRGIPVKVLYPGTSVGREATAGAYFTVYTLLIRGCDFPIAKEIRERLNIKPVIKEMPLPKVYIATKPYFEKYFLFGWLTFYIIAILMTYKEAPFELVGSFFTIASFLFLIWLGISIYRWLLKRHGKNKNIKENKKIN